MGYDAEEQYFTTKGCLRRESVPENVVKKRGFSTFYKPFTPGFYRMPSIVYSGVLGRFEQKLTAAGKNFFQSSVKLRNSEPDYVSIYARASDPSKLHFLPSPILLIAPHAEIELLIVSNPDLGMNFCDFMDERIQILATKITIEASGRPEPPTDFWKAQAEMWGKERNSILFPRAQEIYLPPFQAADGTVEAASEYLFHETNLYNLILPMALGARNPISAFYKACILLPFFTIGSKVEHCMEWVLDKLTMPNEVDIPELNIKAHADDDVAEFLTLEQPVNPDEKETPELELSHEDAPDFAPQFFQRVVKNYLRKLQLQTRAASRLKFLNGSLLWALIICCFFLIIILGTATVRTKSSTVNIQIPFSIKGWFSWYKDEPPKKGWFDWSRT